jgi:hypothetical protein
VAAHRFRATKAEAIATWMDDSPRLRLIDLPAALRDPATAAAARGTYQHAYNLIRTYLNAYGALQKGLLLDR